MRVENLTHPPLQGKRIGLITNPTGVGPGEAYLLYGLDHVRHVCHLIVATVPWGYLYDLLAAVPDNHYEIQRFYRIWYRSGGHGARLPMPPRSVKPRRRNGARTRARTP